MSFSLQTRLQPSRVRSKADLRRFAIQLLSRWLEALDHDRIRLHFPHRWGLMRLVPDMHFHLVPELFLQISGVTHFEFPEESCRVGPGEICLVPRGLPHREKVHTWRGRPFYNLVISYTPDQVHFHLAHEQEGPKILVSCELPGLDGASLAEQLKTAIDCFHEDDAAHRLAVKGCLLTNLAVILVAMKQPPSEPHEPFKVMQARQLVMQYLAETHLSVEWLGRSLRSSPDYLSRLFRQSTGKSLIAFITECRVARARDLLEVSSLNIAEISRAAGYEDPSYFTRVFRKETGLSPRRYRERVPQTAEWVDPALADKKWDPVRL